MTTDKLTTTTPDEVTAPVQMQTQAGQLLAMVTQQGANTETLEAVAKLYREEREDQRRTSFNAAMAEAQTEMRPVSADATNPQTRSKYASYAALDKALRSIYTRHGFGLSFDTADTDVADMVRVVCVVSHREGYERKHHIDMPADGCGIKGSRMMTSTHARGSAATYGMRYLLKMIFNVSIGEDDNDGNITAPAQPIGKTELATINGLLDRLPESVKENMLGAYGIATVEEIPAARFPNTIKALNKYIDDGELPV